MTCRRLARSGFTLLELILAVTVGVVLLGALYLALATQFHHAKAGREVMDEAALVRSLFTRIAGDVSSNLGPGGSAPQDSDSGADDATTPSTSSSTPTVQNSGPFNLGVLGDSQRLVLTVSRVPRELDPTKDTTSVQVSDLRTITYWLVGNGDQTQGLARQEITRITGPDADNLPPDVANPESYLISSRVKDMTLEYFDGSTWKTSWDGGSIDSASQKPTGPPAAIAITLKVQATDGAQGRARTYRHVVAIPAANRWVAADGQ